MKKVENFRCNFSGQLFEKKKQASFHLDTYYLSFIHLKI